MTPTLNLMLVSRLAIICQQRQSKLIHYARALSFTDCPYGSPHEHSISKTKVRTDHTRPVEELTFFYLLNPSTLFKNSEILYQEILFKHSSKLKIANCPIPIENANQKTETTTILRLGD